MKTPEAHLVELLQQGRVIPVIGAGVSNAVADLPGWKGAIEDGLKHAQARSLDATQITAAYSLLHQDDLTGAATILKTLLNAPRPPFSNWIADLFYNPTPKSTDLLKSIAYLCAPIVLTTNYDNLLSSTKILGDRAVYTWRDSQQIEQALGTQEEIIVHLHGLATRPDTIILSAGDYALLNANLGYKAVLQKLWTSYHFLFIGCSSAGVTDDDFSTVISFLNEWFPHTTHRHYMLLNQRDIDNNSHVRLLQSGNIEAISFGTDYQNLANRLNELNPNLAKSLQETVRAQQSLQQKIQELQELLITGEHRSRISALLKEAMPGGIYWIDSPQLSLMEKALQEVNQQLTSSKKQLQFYQSLIQGFIELSEVTAAVELWNASNGNPAVLNNDGFVNLAIICHECLARIPADLLQEIRHRAAYAIHTYYYEGYLTSFILEYKLKKKRSGAAALASYQTDRYFFENLKRIIASLQGFLELNASDLFGEMKAALIANGLPQQFLLLVTREALSIRDRSFPNTELARLEAEANLPFLGAEVCTYNGQRYVVGFTSRKCFYWNPVQDLLPTTFFENNHPDAMQGLFILPNGPGLQLSIFAGGILHTFTDFVRSARVKVALRLRELVYVSSTGAFYGLKSASVGERDTVLFQVLSSGAVVPLLSAIDLWNLARTSPYLQAALQNADELEEAAYDYPFIQGGLLQVLAWEQGDVLAYRAKLEVDNHRATLLVLLRMTEQGLEPVCTIIVPKKLSLAFDTFRTRKGVDLVLGYLATGAYPEYLLQLLPAVNTHTQLEVGEDNSFLKTGADFLVDHDIISLTWPTAEEVFAVQGNRKLVIVRLPEQECSEIAVKKIRQVIVVS